MIQLRVANDSVNFSIADSENLQLSFTDATEYPEYSGEYTVTPLRVANDSVNLSIADSENLRLSFPDATAYPEYGGEYTVTPSSEMQILPTARKQCTDDITIMPIPSNYGLIGWNGSFLTVT